MENRLPIPTDAQILQVEEGSIIYITDSSEEEVGAFIVQELAAAGWRFFITDDGTEGFIYTRNSEEFMTYAVTTFDGHTTVILFFTLD
jgi:hypothetical protein